MRETGDHGIFQTLLFHILDVPGLNLGSETSCSG